MSFSKAKLLRFNEINPITPSPADYTILNNSHISGAALSKSDRFVESSPAVSETSSHSSCNLPLFRTPNPPVRRKKTKNVESNIKPVELFRSEDSLDALKEKIVECNNKDQYINELMEQVQDMKQQISDCNVQLLDLSLENSRLAEKLTNLNTDKEVLINDRQKHLTDINVKLITVYNTYNKIEGAKSINCENTNDLKTFLENIDILNDLLESYKTINDRNYSKLQEREEQLSDLENEYINLQKDSNIKIMNMQQEFEQKVENIQLEKNKAEADYCSELKVKNEHIKVIENRLNKEQQTFKLQEQTLLEEHEAKIQQLVKNFEEANALAEIQFEEKQKGIETSWKLKVLETKNECDAILKECQAIAEYNIIQSELEKNQIIYDFNEHKKLFQLLQADHNKLQQEFSSLNDKYKILSDDIEKTQESKIQIQNELSLCKSTIDEIRKEKCKYEVTIMKTHILIETLKNRLMDSDKDVEQLKIELEDTEASKLECEGKCNELEEELCTVLKLFDTISKEIKIARKENEEKAREVEKELHLKVDEFKTRADSKIAILNLELQETKSKLDEALQHLEEQQSINNKAQDVIGNALKDLDSLKKCAKCPEIEETCSQLQKKLEQLENENECLHKKIADQESLIGPFREQLIGYEAEHRALMDQKYNAELEAKEMGLKYAQLLGHQNQKQKIHHLVNLKKKNYELTENIKELETKLRQQSRTIEKLKTDLATASKIGKKKAVENKENISNNISKRI